jgi:hypothetical protein
MRWFGWLRSKPKINHDYLTRLDCNGLNSLHDASRNALILLDGQRKLMLRNIGQLTGIYMQLGIVVNRLDKAVNPKSKSDDNG